MIEPDAIAGTNSAQPPSGPRHDGASTWRHGVEFVAVLLIGIQLLRAFGAEAYIVPTGSMAPTLLGEHLDYTCPNCQMRFALGTDADGLGGRPACPNCGLNELAGSSAVAGGGDRLLVQKYLFDLRAPRRWETVVFQNPVAPEEAYVKRIVGLPGERVLIRDGDIYINGELARKDLAEFRAIRVTVYDHDFLPSDAARFPRWLARLGGSRGAVGSSGWRPAGSRYVRDPRAAADDRTDWLEYNHWQADRGEYGPVRDSLAYNGLNVQGQNRVRDLAIEADVSVGPGIRCVLVRLDHGADRFLISLPVDGLGRLNVRRNGAEVAVKRTAAAGLTSGTGGGDGRFVALEAGIVDRRLFVALSGRPLFEPLDFDQPRDGPVSHASPIGLGVIGSGRAELAHLKITRDIHYTEALAHAPKRPFAVGEPYALGPGEYFVLGDNSAVSNDSRFWPNSPVVRRELLIGKPFLVHLPSQAVPLKVFGHELYWVPDPREIRYIR